MNYCKRALQIFPGGSDGEYGIPPELAPVLTRGEGGRVRDTGGRDYLDMSTAWGVALAGHPNPIPLHRGARPPRAQWVVPSRPTWGWVNGRTVWRVGARSCSARGRAERQPGRLCSPLISRGDD